MYVLVVNLTLIVRLLRIHMHVKKRYARPADRTPHSPAPVAVCGDPVWTVVPATPGPAPRGARRRCTLQLRWAGRRIRTASQRKFRQVALIDWQCAMFGAPSLPDTTHTVLHGSPPPKL